MIRVSALSKTFRLYRKASDRLREILWRRPFHTEHRALENISFTVEDGETLGIIGQNGAGKSTLLKVLTGVLLPDAGQVEINGRITGLLELGTGFNMEMSGLDNIYGNGLLLGMSRTEIDARRDAIAGFSELGRFIHEPIKTYSSGMVMRLAFSIAIHAEPKCFVVDEALSVGDAHFQQKCMTRIREFRQQGGSIIFVSHDMNAIKVLCDKAILLDQGVLIEEGDPEYVVNAYNYLVAQLNDQENRLHLLDSKRHDYGTLAASIEEVSVIGEDSRSAVVSAGEITVIRIVIEAQQDMDEVTVGILIRNRYGQDIFGTNSYHLNQPLRLQAGQRYAVCYTLPMNIGPGKYSLTVALHSGSTHLADCYHWRDQVAAFEVAGNRGELFTGLCKLYPSFTTTTLV